MKQIILVFGLFIVLVFLGCEEKTKDLKVGMNAWVGYEAANLAQDLGYFNKNICYFNKYFCYF